LKCGDFQIDLVGVAAEKTRAVRSEGRNGDVGPVDVVTSDDLAGRSAGPAAAATAEMKEHCRENPTSA